MDVAIFRFNSIFIQQSISILQSEERFRFPLIQHTAMRKIFYPSIDIFLLISSILELVSGNSKDFWQSCNKCCEEKGDKKDSRE